jgi:hypothetical protein
LLSHSCETVEQEDPMKRFKTIAISALAVTLMSATGGAGLAQPAETRPVTAVALGAPADPAGQCWRRLGPFATQYRAYQVRAYAQSRGYVVGPVYGQGGIVARGGRRYYFRVYYRC